MRSSISTWGSKPLLPALCLLLTLLLGFTLPADASTCQNCWESATNASCVRAEWDDGNWSEGWSRELVNVCDCSIKTIFEADGSSRHACAGGTKSCSDPVCGGTNSDDTGILNDNGGTSPIVIDLGDRGFELTGLDDPVEFDIDADGSVETITWTSAAGDDAFLVLDRNGNGAIDDGSELFGTAAEQPPSEEPNGYLALGVFDAAAQGGDGDGWITPADAVWSSLQLWSDLDHDGTAQPLELSRLDDFGIAGIELAYVDSQRRDRHGNLLRWASRVRFEQGLSLAASDVIFLSR